MSTFLPTASTARAAAATSAKAIGTSFSGGTLALTGDGLANSLSVGRDAAGKLLLNGGAMPSWGSSATIANTTLVQISGGAGNDTLALDEAAGPLPRARLSGDDGNDQLTGGSGADELLGGNGDDVLLGGAGDDTLRGGAGNDVLTGGDGADTLFGDAGDDRIVWNPGDDSDIAEGGDGSDTVEVNGGGGNEQFTVTLAGARVLVDRIDPAPFKVDGGGIEKVLIQAGGGDDKVDATPVTAGAVQLTLDGGAGNDLLTGGAGADLLIGGDGNDVLDGNQGADTGRMGAGDDRFIWNPGDGSDLVEGEAGTDVLQFNGAAAAERMALVANGERSTFTRDLGNIRMDNGSVETVEVNALGGADVLSVGDMAGTDVRSVRLDLAGSLGGSTGDGVADSITVSGGAGADLVLLSQVGNQLQLSGLTAAVAVLNFDAGSDTLALQLGAGDDLAFGALLPAAGPALVLDGGEGHDVLLAGQGGTQLLGGAGDDVLIGGAGDDRLDGGAGSNLLVGGAGRDTFVAGAGMVLGFAAGTDRIDLSAFGQIRDLPAALAIAHQVGNLLVLDLGATGLMALAGVDKGTLQATVFVFAAEAAQAGPAALVGQAALGVEPASDTLG